MTCDVGDGGCACGVCIWKAGDVSRRVEGKVVGEKMGAGGWDRTGLDGGGRGRVYTRRELVLEMWDSTNLGGPGAGFPVASLIGA